MTTNITSQEVQHIATLSRLGLSEAELQESAKNLADILGHFTVIQKVDTANVAEATNMSGLHNVTRADVAESNVLCSADDLLTNAPSVQGRHIKVKAVFQEESL